MEIPQWQSIIWTYHKDLGASARTQASVQQWENGKIVARNSNYATVIIKEPTKIGSFILGVPCGKAILEILSDKYIWDTIK